MALGRPQSQHKGQGGEGSRSASPQALQGPSFYSLEQGGRGRGHATALGREAQKQESSHT